MTDTSCILQTAERSKLVQEIARGGAQELPKEFFHKNGFPEAIDARGIMQDNLLIDFSLLSSTSLGVAQDELAKLRTALSTWGCFLVKNHGIESSLLEEVIQVAKQFYELPLEEKLRSSSQGDVLQGYSTDAICNGNQPINWNDRLFLTLHPKETGNPLIWPEKPTRFSEVVDEYTGKLVTVAEGMYKAMARSLNLDDESFSKATKKGYIVGRFALYPPCPCPKSVLGSRPHSDGTAVTIVLADFEGLEVQKHGQDQWFKVPVIPGTLVVNLGDFIEVMSNGIFKSSMHRVVTNAAHERTSVVAYCAPESTYEIQPLTQLVSADQPALYKTFIGYEYMQILYESLAQGRNALEALRL